MEAEPNATNIEKAGDDSLNKESKDVKKEDVANPAPKSQKPKKRAKTGCLTCRKRRIKCGEERPICKNCIKSKRDCGGYVQPVVFKQLNGDIRISGDDISGMYHSTFGPMQTYVPFQHHYGATTSHNMPVVPSHYQYGYDASPGGFQYYTGSTDHGPSTLGDWMTAPHELDSHQQTETMGSHSRSPVQRSYSASSPLRPQWPPWHPANVYPLQTDPFYVPTHFDQNINGDYPDIEQSNVFDASKLEQQTWNENEQAYQHGSVPKPALHRGATFPHLEMHDTFHKIDDITHRRYSAHGFIQQPSFTLNITDSTKDHTANVAENLSSFTKDEEVDSDSDMDVDAVATAPLAQHGAVLNSMLMTYAGESGPRQRTFTRFLDIPGVLATYKPSHSASPLQDEKVARIFCHFVSVTGPCISVFERQVSNSRITVNDLTLPASQKMLWSYLIPSLALQNTALLHAILGLSALHISKLQSTSEAPSLKHFTYAARRVGRLLGLPERRHEAATLAAVLLLGFYEVMSADHSKWSLHLAGAKNLVMEIDYAPLTRSVFRMRNKAKAICAQNLGPHLQKALHEAGMPEALLNDVEWDIDEDLVSRLTGMQIRYSNHWRPNLAEQREIPDLTAHDVEDYKMKVDLRWWYCKQDIFQGMVSGDRVLMPFELWAFCPPRGQVGRLEVAYATMDHLCLVMGRLIDFGGKDRVRKQKAVAAQGGSWKPPPGLFGPNAAHPVTNPVINSGAKSTFDSLKETGSSTMHNGPQTETRDIPVQRQIPLTPLPGMYGMIPPPVDPVPRLSAVELMEKTLQDATFHQPAQDGKSHTFDDLVAETEAALKEHAAIAAAFETFVDALPAEFQPLPADSMPPITTPFGPALQYRTYTVACIWAFYYVGRILLHRLHPHMPPAAMISAGVTAHLTREYAQLVGKICAGLYFPQQWSMQTGNLPPQLSAALIESTFCLLFAGVQYQDAAQRGWTISKLNDISKKTGWQTSASIAAACEVAWQSMGKAGRGPPYEPTMDRNNEDPRIRAVFEQRKASAPSHAPTVPKEGAQETNFYSHDRESIDRNASSRVHWALGLLSVEEDIAKLTLNKT